jgi:hypothetical protein
MLNSVNGFILGRAWKLKKRKVDSYLVSFTKPYQPFPEKRHKGNNTFHGRRIERVDNRCE